MPCSSFGEEPTILAAQVFCHQQDPRRDLALGIACLTVLIVVVALSGIDGGSKSVEATYQASKLAGLLPILWLTIVVLAPVTEELLFRGFLHHGWAASWLGVPGTIGLTSVLWAALHQQYNWLGILCIFLMGLIFGWVRQRSGSTMLTIVLHAINNLVAMILAASVKIFTTSFGNCSVAATACMMRDLVNAV